MNFFLGIEAQKPTSDVVLFNQAKYIKELLKKASMESAKPMPTPMMSSQKLFAHGDDKFNDPTLYKSVVGGLQYATITRPDIGLWSTN